MRICGIDPGLNTTGYGLIDAAPDGHVTRLIEAGVIRTNPSADLSDRLVELAESMEEILSDHEPDFVGMEQLYSHYRHPRTAILMGHARGVLMLSAARARIDVRGVSATRVKRTLTGNGHASKAQMQRAIMAMLGLQRPPEPADVADALAIAICAAREAQADRKKEANSL